LTNKIILKKLNKTADQDALRVIDIMPKWRPGKCNGIAVPVKYVIPIKFRLQ
jgi:periplasmic protein TonB